MEYSRALAKENMYSKAISPVVLAVGALTALAGLSSPTLTHAAKFSDLKVVQEAAQSGMWTMATSGTLPDGKPFPASSNSICATKQQVIESLANPFMWNEKTGEEDRDCPTVLTTNTSTLGVATMTCKAQSIQLPGQAPIAIPAIPLSTEFKRTGQQTWTVKTGSVVTNITYQGAATAGCVAKR